MNGRSNTINNFFNFMLITTCFFIANSYAAPLFSDVDPTTQQGKVYFRGGLYGSPCTLDISSDGQAIDMGNISARQFRNKGETSQEVNVRLIFRDCFLGQTSFDEDNAHRQRSNDKIYTENNATVRVSLNGISHIDDNSLLALSGVKGVGLRLNELSGRKLAINNDVPNIPIQQGDNVWEFSAKLESTRKYVLADEFSAVLNISLKYL